MPLQTISEETLGSESQGSMETLAETFSEQLLLPSFWGGAIFNVSIDSPPRNGETQPGHISTENRTPNRTETEPNSRFFGFSVRFQFLLSDSSVIGVGFGSCVEPNRTTEVCIVGCLNRRKPETIADALPSILRPN